MKYEHSVIEKKWQKYWDDHHTFEVKNDYSKPKFYGLVEELRENLKKKVDVLDQKQIKDNFELTNEILKDGIKIYG